MTDEELKAIETWATSDDGENPWDAVETGARHVIALVAEVRRLKGLIKEAGERSLRENDWCVFCLSHRTDSTHRQECPAFTPDGEVK